MKITVPAILNSRGYFKSSACCTTKRDETLNASLVPNTTTKVGNGRFSLVKKVKKIVSVIQLLLGN